MNRTKNNQTILKAAMIALALCVAGAGQAAADEETAGTIGAAQRYDNHTTRDADIVLAVDETQGLLQSEAFQRLIDDPKRAQDPAFIRLLDDPDVYVAMTNGGDSFAFIDMGGNSAPRHRRIRSLTAVEAPVALALERR